MLFNFKNHLNIFLILIYLILINCQLKETVKNHGIVFLENRSKKLTINKTNKNDVINIIGHPHSKSINDENTWIYLERTLNKGKYYKLGKNVLIKNNTLILSFDQYGVLKEKNLYDLDDLKKVKFSKKQTTNELSRRSFVESFLSSVKEKMYSNRKK
jgi:outer membrane protein assembly factor BamE (lipoprotein component of BamABCDE complex)